DSAGVDAHAAHDGFALDDRHALAELGALDGRALTSRPGADHHQIVLEVRHVLLQCNSADPAIIELQAAKQSPDTTYESPSRVDPSRSLRTSLAISRFGKPCSRFKPRTLSPEISSSCR